MSNSCLLFINGRLIFRHAFQPVSRPSLDSRRLMDSSGRSQVLFNLTKRHLALSETRRSSKIPKEKNQGRSVSFYIGSLAVAMFGASFAAVPLYRLYCQSNGLSGQAVLTEDEQNIINMKSDPNRLIKVTFLANTHSAMAWNFQPLQKHVFVRPGETALAFYRAKNPLDEPVVGVATYTVLPYGAGIHFNKIQCFCFEEQMLRPHEDVFLPVLFYLDPQFSKDSQLGTTDEVVLHYTFFRSINGELEDYDDDEPIKLKKHN